MDSFDGELLSLPAIGEYAAVPFVLLPVLVRLWRGLGIESSHFVWNRSVKTRNCVKLSRGGV